MRLLIIMFWFIGVTHVGGDMFVWIPVGDAIFMKVRVLDNTIIIVHK